MKTTFFMFNESVKEFDDVIRDEKLEGEYGYKEYTDIPPGQILYPAKFFYQINKKEPEWFTFLEELIAIDGFENQSCSFIILLKASGRIFAVPKGYGAYFFDRKKMERNFGLKICLNEIDAEKIKSLDTRSLEKNPKIKRTVVSQSGQLSAFNVNSDLDLIRLISGEPISENLAKSMVGSDGITISRDDFSIKDLDRICSELYESFKKETYKDNFSFIDYITQVTDENLISHLDNSLYSDFNNFNEEKFSIVFPFIPDFELITQWEIWDHQTSRKNDDLNIVFVKNFLEIPVIKGKKPEEIKVAAKDSNGENIQGIRKLDYYLHYETDHNGSHYVFAENNWYSIADDFLQRVNASVMDITLASINFPEWPKSNKNEGVYNKKVAKLFSNRFCLDNEDMYVEGRGKIEVCDLLEDSRIFIHVKRYSASKSMGHLFNQGTISAQVLREDRRRIVDWIKEKGFANDGADENKGIDVTPIEELDGIKVVFAIGYDDYSGSPIEKILPFFSKVALFNARKIIENTCGFPLEICIIPRVDK